MRLARIRIARLLFTLCLGLLVAVPATAYAARGSFYGGPDQSPLYVPNDHTPIAVHFGTDEASSGLEPNTSYYVKVRFTPTPVPGGVANRGFTWNQMSHAWAQERTDWVPFFPRVTTDGFGAIPYDAGWVYTKFGDETKSGTYYLMISLSATGLGNTLNSRVETVTVLDARTQGSWVHNGIATGKPGAVRALISDAASTTILGLQRTEANASDDDSDTVVDNEDYGPPGSTGDFRSFVPASTPLRFDLDFSTWISGNGFVSGPADVDLAVGASDTVAPSAPGSLLCSSGDGTASVSWAAASDDNAIGGYFVYRSPLATLGAAYSPIHSRVATLPASGRAYSDSGLTNGEIYSYEVRAFDTSGNVGPRSASVAATPSAPPSPPLPVYRFRNLINGFYLWSMDPAERADINARLASTWTEEGEAYSINPATNVSTLMRFRNISGGFYLYSADPAEWADINAKLSASWVQEGPAYNISRTYTAGAKTVWRFRNRGNGTYLYSADPVERADINARLGASWQEEGEAYYLAP